MEKNCEECLGELFSAQKGKIEVMEINIASLIETAGNAERYRRVLEDKLLDKDERIKALQKSSDDAIEFLQDLRDLPPRWCWATSYSSRIWQFLEDRGL